MHIKFLTLTPVSSEPDSLAYRYHHWLGVMGKIFLLGNYFSFSFSFSIQSKDNFCAGSISKLSLQVIPLLADLIQTVRVAAMRGTAEGR